MTVRVNVRPFASVAGYTSFRRIDMSTSVQSSPHQSNGWIECYALISYFVLTYLVGWIAMIPRVLASLGLLPADLSSMLFDLILVL